MREKDFTKTFDNDNHHWSASGTAIKVFLITNFDLLLVISLSSEMDAQQHTPQSMHDWLWMNRELSDVLLSIIPAETSQILAGEDASRLDTETLVERHDESSPSDSNSSSSARSNTAVKSFSPQNELQFSLHSQVICSASMYFRARLATSVGTACVGSKRRVCGSGSVRLEERIRAEDASAAVSVLHFFYTNLLHHEEDDATTPEEQLCMLQVGYRCSQKSMHVIPACSVTWTLEVSMSALRMHKLLGSDS